MWTNPSQKSRQGSDPPPHSGNACILGASGPGTPPLKGDYKHATASIAATALKVVKRDVCTNSQISAHAPTLFRTLAEVIDQDDPG